MTHADVPDAERVSDDGFFELDARLHRSGLPAPARRSDAHRAVWLERTHHFVDTDPGGCWVAQDGSGIVGMVTSFRRETLWCLATYAVVPGRQGRGIGKPLLAAALHHGRGCTRGMVSGSADPRASRIYHQAGFALHPQMFLQGTVDRSALPVLDARSDKVREGSAADVDLLDSLDRGTRGAAHGPDHVLMLRTWRLLVSDTTTGSGYAYVNERGSLALLAASNRRTAARLLWRVLADGPDSTTVAHVTAANQWVLEVGLAARLELQQEGFLGLRGMTPPAPYVHNGALL
jgi:GNAT superfamily N-acetyltransferase